MNRLEIIMTLCVIYLVISVIIYVGLGFFVKAAVSLIVATVIVIVTFILMDYFDPET